MRGQCHPPPVKGQFSLRIATLTANGLVELFPDPFELGLAVGAGAVTPLEAQGQAEVHQFQEVQVALGVGQQAVEGGKEFLATPGLVVEADQESLMAPDAPGAPRGVQDGFVDEGAEDIASRQHHRVHQTLGPGTGLEGADLSHQSLAQTGGIGMGQGPPQLPGQGQQPGGATHQGIEQGGLGGQV